MKLRGLITIILSLACGLASTAALAQDISDPGCAAIEDWVSPLSTARGRAGGQALSRQSELLEQIFSDAETEALFGFAFSRWQVPQYESAGAITDRCLAEVRSRNDAEVTIKLSQANGRIQDRLRRAQAASRSNPAASRSAVPAKVDRPDCDTLQAWAGTLMTDEERRNAVMEGLDDVAMREQREALLLSDNEIEPRFGYPISEWTYNDFVYASEPITRCAGEANSAGNNEAYDQLRGAYSIIRRLGNELR